MLSVNNVTIGCVAMFRLTMPFFLFLLAAAGALLEEGAPHFLSALPGLLFPSGSALLVPPAWHPHKAVRSQRPLLPRWPRGPQLGVRAHKGPAGTDWPSTARLQELVWSALRGAGASERGAASVLDKRVEQYDAVAAQHDSALAALLADSDLEGGVERLGRLDVAFIPIVTARLEQPRARELLALLRARASRRLERAEELVRRFLGGKLVTEDFGAMVGRNEIDTGLIYVLVQRLSSHRELQPLVATLLTMRDSPPRSLERAFAEALSVASPRREATAAGPIAARMRHRRARPAMAKMQDGEGEDAVKDGLKAGWLQVRRTVYNQLRKLDQGDFRWEFLVPWVDRKLTEVDKFIVCSSFIGIALAIQTATDPGASVGVHLAYIAEFFQYALSTPIGYRSLAILNAALEIVGNVFERGGNGLILSGFRPPDLTAMPDFKTILQQIDDDNIFPIFYDQLFIVINGYYLLRFLLNREEDFEVLEWGEDQQILYDRCFAPLGLSRAQFQRLLESATFITAGPGGDVLTAQGEPTANLHVPLSGMVEVRVDGVVATRLPAFSLIGDASLLDNLQSPDGSYSPPARATVVAAEGARYVTWAQTALYELQCEEDSEMAMVVQRMIARSLSEKLKTARLAQKQAEALLAELGERRRPATTPAGEEKEIQALRQRGAEYSQRIEYLERTLERERGTFADLKKVVVISTALLSLGLAGFANDLGGPVLLSK